MHARVAKGGAPAWLSERVVRRDGLRGAYARSSAILKHQLPGLWVVTTGVRTLYLGYNVGGGQAARLYDGLCLQANREVAGERQERNATKPGATCIARAGGGRALIGL